MVRGPRKPTILKKYISPLCPPLGPGFSDSLVEISEAVPQNLPFEHHPSLKGTKGPGGTMCSQSRAGKVQVSLEFLAVPEISQCSKTYGNRAYEAA